MLEVCDVNYLALLGHITAASSSIKIGNNEEESGHPCLVSL